MLDYIVLDTNANILKTCDLQFGFISKHSTTQCTFVLQEIIDLYVRLKSPVYVMLLDASKAFDRIEYVKLFRILQKRGLCPSIIRLLLNIYTNQKLTVKWKSTYSDFFKCNNGVKQGGVISPILFCIYMDDLLNRLQMSKIGCFLGNRYAGAVCYADDLTLIAPSRNACKQMLQICESYAKEYHVKYNATKSVMIMYNVQNDCDPELTINGDKIKVVDNALHLGHYIGNNSDKLNTTKGIQDMVSKTNMIIARFGFCYSNIKSQLFESYCCSYYGCPIWNLNGKYCSKFQVAWRNCIRKVWQLPARSHRALVNVISGKPSIHTQLLLRFTNFFCNAIQSVNSLVSICAKMSFYSNTAVGQNCRFLMATIMKNNNIFHLQNCKSSISYIIRCQETNQTGQYNHIGDIIQELCFVRDGMYTCVISAAEATLLVPILNLE